MAVFVITTPDELLHRTGSKAAQELAVAPITFKHPPIVNIEGNLGVLKKLEFECRQQFFQALPKEDRKAIREREMRISLAATEQEFLEGGDGSSDQVKTIPGMPELEEAVRQLVHDHGFSYAHPWLLKFIRYRQSEVDDRLDEADIARKQFVEAELCRRRAEFVKADQLYDCALASFLESMGGVPPRPCK